MKSFLDRFKRRDPGDRARAVASESAANLSVVPPVKPASTDQVAAGSAKDSEAKAAGSSQTPVPPDAGTVSTINDTEVQLALGDFLHRIPQNLLRPGPHNVASELRFNVTELSSLISRGQTSINLAEIYTRAPGIFRAEVRTEDNVEVRFPWQKLMSVVKAVGSAPVGKVGITQAAADALAHKLRSRRPSRGIATGVSVTGPIVKPAPTLLREPAPSETAGSTTRGWQPAGDKADSSKQTGEPSSGSPPVVAVEAPASPDTCPQSTVGTSPTSPSGIGQEELIRLREELATLNEERGAIAAERDKAVADLDRAREELAAKVKELAERQAAIAAETASALASERTVWQEELAAKASQLDALAAEVTSGDEKLAAVAQERDKALHELDRLRNEIAELRKNDDERIADILKERQALVHERDELVANCEKTKNELEALKGQVVIAKEKDEGQTDLEGTDRKKNNKARQTALAQERDKALAELEAIKAELASLRNGGGKKLTAICEERDKVLADLRRARQELADKVEQIEFQQNLVARSSEDTAKALADRIAVEKKLASMAAELEASKKNGINREQRGEDREPLCGA